METTTAKQMIVTRLFNAPRQLVWDAWTKKEHLLKWFAPKGVTMTACEIDLRPGGTMHYAQRIEGGMELWGKWTFREIVPPERLVLVSSFSDAQGGVTRSPMVSPWPLEMLSTTTLKEQNGKTLLTIEWLPINATTEELATFDSAHAGMDQGWNSVFDKLEEYLTSSIK